MPAATWEHFKTASIDPAQRVVQWTEWSRSMFGALAVAPANPKTFSARMSKIALPSLSLAHLQFTSARAHGADTEDVDPLADALMISMPVAGTCLHRRPAATLDIGAGDIIVRDLARPWELDAKSDTDLITIRIPYARIAERIGDPDALIGRKFSGQSAEVGFVAHTIHSALRVLETSPDADQQQTLADIIIDSLRLLRPDQTPRSGTTTSGHMALRRSAIVYMLRNLAEPGLSSTTIAAALGVSSRRLQRAFGESGETIQELVLEHRLTRAERLIREQRPRAGKSITAIALSVGFNDVSYFSRAFSRRFGVSPRTLQSR